jgi:crossover junction endodeoxyribonuclease RuvC
MIILGIDPGFGITGYGLIEVNASNGRQPRIVEAGVLTSKKSKPLSERLHEIHKHLSEILQEHSPSALAVEDIYSIHAFPRSAICIGNVQGIVLLAAAQKAVPVFTYFPIQVKKALLGYGRATKTQVQQMVQRTLELKQIPQPDDAADALAVALCHANRIKTV